MAEAPANHDQIRYWNEQSGPRWVRHQQRFDAQLNQLGLAAMQRAEVKLGEHVLDVGCGCGQTSLELAERVSPQGSVVGIDISQPMLARAQERQNELKVKNLQFLRADAQTHPFEQERFDLIFSRFGVMFFDNPLTAFHNLSTALRPDGRVCFICWQAIEKNDWVRIPLMAASQYVQLPTPSLPNPPGPFALADPDHVRRILETAGFKDVRLEAHEAGLSLGGAQNVDEAIDFVLEISVIATLLRDATPDVRARAVQAIRVALEPYANRDGVRLGGAAWIVSAQLDR